MKNIPIFNPDALRHLPKSALVDGYACVDIQSPADTLLPAAQDSLFGGTYTVALDAFGQEDSEGFREDVFNHVVKVENLCVVFDDCDDRLVAFCSWRQLRVGADEKVVYIQGVCAGASAQKTGVGRALIRRAVSLAEEPGAASPGPVSWIALRTQNPAMARCLQKVGAGQGSFYAFGYQDSVPGRVSALARQVAEKLGDRRVDPDLLVSRAVYGQCLYGPSVDVQAGSRGTPFEGLRHADGDAAYCLLSLR